MLHADAIVQVSRAREGRRVSRQAGPTDLWQVVTTAEVGRVVYVRDGLEEAMRAEELTFGVPGLEGYPPTYDSIDELRGAYVLLSHDPRPSARGLPAWTLEAVMQGQGPRARLLGPPWLSAELERFRAYAARTIGPPTLSTVDLVRDWVREGNQIRSGSIPAEGAPGRSVMRAYQAMHEEGWVEQVREANDSPIRADGYKDLRVRVRLDGLTNFDGIAEVSDGGAGPPLEVEPDAWRSVFRVSALPGRPWTVILVSATRERRMAGAIPPDEWDVGFVMIEVTGSFDRPVMVTGVPGPDDHPLPASDD